MMMDDDKNNTPLYGIRTHVSYTDFIVFNGAIIATMLFESISAWR
jgi:hypothetical protein